MQFKMVFKVKSVTQDWNGEAKVKMVPTGAPLSGTVGSTVNNEVWGGGSPNGEIFLDNVLGDIGADLIAGKEYNVLVYDIDPVERAGGKTKA